MKYFLNSLCFTVLLTFLSHFGFSQFSVEQYEGWHGALPRVSVSPVSNHIATYQKYTCGIFITTSEEEKELKIPEWEGKEIFGTYSPDEKYFVAGVLGGSAIKIYQLPSYNLKTQFDLKDHLNYNMTISEMGKLAITDGSKIYLYQLEEIKKKAKPYSVINKSHVKFLYGMAFQPKTENLALGGLGLMQLINLETKESIYEYVFAGQKKRNYVTPLTRLVFDQTGRYLALGDDYSLASIPEDERYGTGFTIIDLNTKEVILSKSMGGKTISGFAFGQESNTVIVSNYSGFIYKYSLSGDVIANIKMLGKTSITAASNPNHLIVHDLFGPHKARLWRFNNWDQIPDGKYEMFDTLEPLKPASNKNTVKSTEKKSLQQMVEENYSAEERAKIKAEQQAAELMAEALAESKAVNEKRQQNVSEERPNDLGYESAYEQGDLKIKYRLGAYAPSSKSPRMAKIDVIILNDSGSEKSGKFLIAYGDGTNAEGQEIDFCLSDTAGKKLSFMSEKVTAPIDKVEVSGFLMNIGCNK